MPTLTHNLLASWSGPKALGHRLHSPEEELVSFPAGQCEFIAWAGFGSGPWPHAVWLNTHWPWGVDGVHSHNKHRPKGIHSVPSSQGSQVWWLSAEDLAGPGPAAWEMPLGKCFGVP